MKMIWKRQASETGLSRVIQGERGWDLQVGEEHIGRVRPRYEGGDRTKTGYYWVVSSHSFPAGNIPWNNTASNPSPTVEQAISEMEKYIRKYTPSAKINRASLTRADIQIPK